MEEKNHEILKMHVNTHHFVDMDSAGTMVSLQISHSLTGDNVNFSDNFTIKPIILSLLLAVSTPFRVKC